MLRLGDGKVFLEFNQLVQHALENIQRVCIVVLEKINAGAVGELRMELNKFAIKPTIYYVGHDWVLDSISEFRIKLYPNAL